MAINTFQWLKKGIWLYIFLLIFEGALRKWILPGLATPLLVVRDPIAILLILSAWKNGLLPANPYLTFMTIIGVISIFTAVLLGHGSVFVAIYGARILMLHFPLVFIIGRIFERRDVIHVGNMMLWIAIPMTILLLLQFYSPQSAWVNRGLGGDSEGGGFSGANGYYRPPGTFSFITGLVQFYSLLVAFIFSFWLDKEKISKILLVGATISLMLAVPFSISRTLMFQLCLTIVFTAVAIFRNTKYLGQSFLIGISLVVVFVVLSSTSFFKTGIDAFSSRFETASQQGGGLAVTLSDRILGDQLGSITSEGSQQPFFGFGLGMGTNAGGMLLSGKRTFLISETEWGRLIGELGLLMGLIVILIRVSLVLKIALACYYKVLSGDLLPWLLLSFGFLSIAQGQWAQPTTLGFSTLTGGLIIASLRVRKNKGAEIITSNSTADINII